MLEKQIKETLERIFKENFNSKGFYFVNCECLHTQSDTIEKDKEIKVPPGEFNIRYKNKKSDIYYTLIIEAKDNDEDLINKINNSIKKDNVRE